LSFLTQSTYSLTYEASSDVTLSGCLMLTWQCLFVVFLVPLNCCMLLYRKCPCGPRVWNPYSTKVFYANTHPIHPMPARKLFS